jgi:hypothetical protein
MNTASSGGGHPLHSSRRVNVRTGYNLTLFLLGLSSTEPLSLCFAFEKSYFYRRFLTMPVPNKTNRRVSDASRRCEHGRERHRCKDCKALGAGGTSICEHNRRRDRCSECSGSQICEHSRQRGRCSVCKPYGTYRQYKWSAEHRGYAFLITLDDFKKITAEPCFFCGESEQPRGIDRWDNKIGYEFPNCRPCCGPCNKFKSTRSGPDFVEHCISIADNVRAVEAANDAFPQQESV